MEHISFEKAFYISSDYNKNYENVVNCIGLEKLIPHIPFTKEEIKNAYEKDKHLNTLSMKKWNQASGIRVHQTSDPEVVYDWFFRLIQPFGVTAISQSQIISTLKHAAIMWLDEPA